MTVYQISFHNGALLLLFGACPAEMAVPVYRNLRWKANQRDPIFMQNLQGRHLSVRTLCRVACGSFACGFDHMHLYGTYAHGRHSGSSAEKESFFDSRVQAQSYLLQEAQATHSTFSNSKGERAFQTGEKGS
jgi:hypothetical protein